MNSIYIVTRSKEVNQIEILNILMMYIFKKGT